MKNYKEYLERAKAALKQADTLKEEWGKENDINVEAMPQELVNKIASYLDESRNYKRMAENEKSSTELTGFFAEPERTHPYDTRDAENKESKFVEKNTPFEMYLRCGMSGLSYQQRADINTLEGAEGGVLCPEEMASEILKKMEDYSHIRRISRVIPINGKSWSMPEISYDLSMPFVREGASTTSQSFAGAFGKTTFTPKKRSIIMKFTEESLEDSAYDVVGEIIGTGTEQYSLVEESLYFTGSGANEPLGLITADLDGDDIAGSTSEITIADLVTGFYSLSGPYRNRCSILMPTAVMSHISRLTVTDYSPSFAWNKDISQPFAATLFGRPVYECSSMPSCSTDGDPMVIYGDMSKYYIVDRKGFTVKRSADAGEVFNKDQIAIKLTSRTDAAPIDRYAFWELRQK